MSDTSLPTDAAARKNVPIATGCVDYFPDALAAVAALSKKGNDQHNPGQPLHWDRAKSTDEADALMRHFLDRGTMDTDGIRHSAKVAWRALALLQKEIEAERVVKPAAEPPKEDFPAYVTAAARYECCAMMRIDCYCRGRCALSELRVAAGEIPDKDAKG
jgi:hypothetical protein